MFGNKYLYMAVVSTNILCTVCYVNYELFQGFDNSLMTSKDHHSLHNQTNTATHRIHNAQTHKAHNASHKMQETSTTEEVVVNVTSTVTNTVMSTISSTNTSLNSTETTKFTQNPPKIKVREFKKECPETERPLSIGTYEIPTQRDLVLFTKRTLLKMFNSYHEKTLYLLKDIKEATRATVAVEKKCYSKKTLYKQCVKQVSKKCVSITKELVASLERQEEEVAALTKDKVCNMTSMSTDPIQLIKILAMDEAMLDFALPAFLRLLGSCSTYCQRPSAPDHRPRLRQLTDQDLVVRYFLTNKNYVQLIKDTNTYV